MSATNERRPRSRGTDQPSSRGAKNMPGKHHEDDLQGSCEKAHRRSGLNPLSTVGLSIKDHLGSPGPSTPGDLSVASTVVGSHFGQPRRFSSSTSSQISRDGLLDRFMEEDGGAAGKLGRLGGSGPLVQLKMDNLPPSSGHAGLQRSPSTSSVSSASSTPSIASFTRHPLARALLRSPSVEVASEEGPMHQSPACLESPAHARASPTASAVRAHSINSSPGQKLNFAGLNLDSEGRDRSAGHSEHNGSGIQAAEQVYSGESGEEAEEEDMPSRPSIAMSEGGQRRSFVEEDPQFCLGIKWFIRHNKLVVGSFSSWSVADKLGVKHGDILRAVDGHDILRLTPPERGKRHPAEEMLNGAYGTMCELKLMRVDAGQVQQMMDRAKDGVPVGRTASAERLVLAEVAVSVPRLIMCKPGEGLT